MIMISGGTDLSVGQIMAVIGVGIALLMEAGVPVPAACLLGVLIGIVVGGFDGLADALFKISNTTLHIVVFLQKQHKLF